MDPIAAIVVTLSLLLLFILALVLGSRALRRRRRDRREAYAAAATARGWTYEERGGGLTNMFTGKPFRRGATRRPAALDVVSGMPGGRRAVGFRYRYTRGTNPDTMADIYTWYTVCALELRHAGRAEPGGPSGPLSFTVDHGHELVRRVMRSRRVKWRVDGDWLLCVERGTRAGIDEILARIELLSAIADGRAGTVHAAPAGRA